MIALTIAASLLLVVAAYAQLQIPRFTSGRANTAVSRAILAATGIALGSVSAAVVYPDSNLVPLAFLVGFGVVHFPAAIILFFKDARHSGKS